MRDESEFILARDLQLWSPGQQHQRLDANTVSLISESEILKVGPLDSCCNKSSRWLDLLPRDAIINTSCLTHQNLSFSQFWRLETWEQGVSRFSSSILPLAFRWLPSPWFCRWSFLCGSTSQKYFCVCKFLLLIRTPVRID